MALQITPNQRTAGNLNITANQRARMSSVLAIDWGHVTGVPDGITAIGSATGLGLIAIIDTDGHGATRTIQPPAAGITVTNGGGVAGDPTLALANDLAALEGLASTGFAARTATDTWAQRTLTAPAAGFTITNPAGVAGNPTFVLANDLAAVEGLASTGIAVRSATDTWVQRTITGTAAEITLTNGDGVSGNPTASLPTSLTFTGKTITGGTYASAGTYNKVTITAPASAATLTLIDGTTLTGPASSGTVMTLGNTETVTGVKTFGSAGAVGRFKLAGTTSGTTVLDATAIASGTITVPAATDTLVGKATTDILTNKTFDTAGAGNSFSINSLAATANTGTGSVVRATSPTLVTPALGTPTALVLTSATGLPLAGLAAQAAFTFVGNNTSGSAIPTAVDIAALTTKASPAASDYAIISDQAASGAWKKATVSSLASAGSVSSIAGNTGAFTLTQPITNATNAIVLNATITPQGRLTLQTATPIMTTTQSAKTTIFYTPYVGNLVPIYDGINMIPTSFAEISVLTTDTTKSAAAIGASKVNDWFVWNDAGTIRIGHGPDWSSDTARTDALTRVNGILLNAVSITNGPAASRGTYVGTTRSNGSSQLDWIIGGSAAGGTAAFLWVFNAHNRRPFEAFVQDSNVSWAYTSATWRSADNSTAFRISFVRGLDEDGVRASYSALALTTTNAVQMALGIGLDATNAVAAGSITASTFFNTTNTNQIAGTASYSGHPGFGAHFLQAIESGGTGGTFNGVNGVQSGGLYATIWH